MASTPNAQGSAGRRRIGTVFGWVAGGSLGLLSNYGLFRVFGEGYPIVPTTFALFVAGCFGGMYAADRLGDGAFRTLGIAAGVLLAAALTLVGALFMTQGR